MTPDERRLPDQEYKTENSETYGDLRRSAEIYRLKIEKERANSMYFQRAPGTGMDRQTTEHHIETPTPRQSGTKLEVELKLVGHGWVEG